MTTTATAVQHKPWCNDHSGPTPDWPGATDLCSWERHVVGNYHVNVEEGENGSQQPYVAVWGQGDPMTLQEAEATAAAILDAVAIVKEEVVRARGALTLAQIEGMDLSELLGYARERDVAVSDVMRVAEKDYDPNA
jgi:hypothetical protein